MLTQNRRFTIILSSAAFLWFIPLVAMQFTSEVKWSALDFAIAAVLLFGSGLLCELVMRKVKKIEYRLLFCGIALLIFFLVWAELAVGIFGTPFAGS